MPYRLSLYIHTMNTRHYPHILLLLLVAISFQAKSQQVIRLWQQDAPGARGSADEDIPTVTFYQAPQATNTRTCVLICPGGGYTNLAFEKEGTKFAEWFNTIGVNAAVLKYRLNTWDCKRYAYPAQFDDATRAMRLLRHKAAEWNLDTARIGIMGFSAGGHLASVITTHYNKGNHQDSDRVERHSSRPDFSILVYPVISFTTKYAHRFSRKLFCGTDDIDPEFARNYSSELQVTTFTPPTFLVHADDDTGVPPENSVLFYMALRQAAVPAEIHIFQKGGHGFGTGSDKPHLEGWTTLLKNWMANLALLNQ